MSKFTVKDNYGDEIKVDTLPDIACFTLEFDTSITGYFSWWPSASSRDFAALVKIRNAINEILEAATNKLENDETTTDE